MKPQSVASIKRHRTAKMAKIIGRALYLQKRGRASEVATYICDEMMLLGGVYIKFLQGVMLQSDYFKNWDSPNRYNIFENLDTELINLPELLQQELPKSKLSIIAQIQPQPFAAGSFGQVYYATLRDGTPVVIKAIRPLVRETLRFDLRLINVFAKQLFIKLYENIQVNFDSAISEFKHSTLNETDYVAEAKFANELYEAYKNHPKFVIPKTYLELCTSNIIVQEYIGGISIAQLIRLQEQGIIPINYVSEQLNSSLDEQLTTLGSEYIKGMFTLPRIQGDPHPGNVKLLEDNKVALIDFGIVAPAPKDQASFFALIEEYGKLYEGNIDIEELFGKFLRFFAHDLYKAFKRLHDMKGNNNESSEDLTKTIGKLAKKAYMSHATPTGAPKLTNDGNMLKFINQIVNKQNRFGLVLTVQSSEILRAAQTYITLVESLNRGKHVLPKMFKDSINNLKIEKPELLIEPASNISIAGALEIVTKWLERVAIRDPALFQRFIRQIRSESSTKGSKINSSSRKENKKETVNV